MPPISTVLFSCLISFLVPCYSSSRAAVPTPTEKFSHHINLDSNGKFHLYWKFNATHITFEAHVKTTGYIGFGFSAHGQMFPADVVIGWVKDGRTYFKDRHTVGHFEPVVDASQDWYLLHGEENTFGTVIKTVRKFDTCDANDIKITGGLATYNEMCLTFLLYYPRTKIDSCRSIPVYDNIPKIPGKNPTDQYNLSVRAEREEFKAKLKTSTYYASCHGSHYTHVMSHLIKPKTPYRQSSSNCKSTPNTAKQTSFVHPEVSTSSGRIQKCVFSTPTENYNLTEKLDPEGKYVLYWKSNKTHITFETHVQTKGYVGFGLSWKGKMFPADVIIGWVKDGQTHFADRHTVGHSKPLLDASQDWHLLYSRENECGTVLKMVRKLDTCDANDFKITDDTIKIIYSFHPQDPSTDDDIPYHGMNRGARSLMLLSKVSIPSIPSDAQYYDLLNHNYNLPPQYTTYSCRIFDIAGAGRDNKRKYMIKFEALVEKGNEGIVHHIVVYKCRGIDRKYIEASSYNCYHPPAAEMRPCGNIFVGWAVGAEPYYFPSDVSLPIGGPDDGYLYIMETHYTNPMYRTDYWDHSGIRITYTHTPRLHEAGILVTGMSVNKFQVIPPYQDTFVSHGFCSQECLHQGLSGMPNGVKVFSVWHHAHLLAKGLKTRLIRNGTEIEPLADDQHYDFDYQDYRHVNRTLMDGDRIIVDCIYTSKDERNVTFGGLGTNEEMCFSILFYYPRIDVQTCVSSPVYNNQYKSSSECGRIMSGYDWTNATVMQSFKQQYSSSLQRLGCVAGKHYNMTIRHEDPVKPYTPIHTPCH